MGLLRRPAPRNDKFLIAFVLPQLSEKERHLSYRDVVQQWFYVLTLLFLISSPSPL
jgi:hypothetical protein